MVFKIGPEKQYYPINFKNLKQNTYKQNLDIELKKLEEDGNCPKYIKTYIPFSAAISNAIKQLTSDEYTEIIKNTYIGNGGIWITNTTSTADASAADSASVHIPQDKKYNNKYIKLWNESIYEYLPTKFSQLGYEYEQNLWYFGEGNEKEPLIDILTFSVKIPTQDEVNDKYKTKWTDYLWNPNAYKDNTANIPDFSDLKVCTSKKLNPDWPYTALYIDTINYNYWQKQKDELKVLYTQFSMLTDQVQPSDDTDPKRENGEEYDPVCDRYYPLDYQKMLNLPALLPPLMSVPRVNYDIRNETYSVKLEINDYNHWIRNLAEQYVAENKLPTEGGEEEEIYYEYNDYNESDYQKIKKWEEILKVQYEPYDTETNIDWSGKTRNNYI